MEASHCSVLHSLSKDPSLGRKRDEEGECDDGEKLIDGSIKAKEIKKYKHIIYPNVLLQYSYTPNIML